jgi:TetR/AcrR family transcriptional repressor of nem operon
MNDYVQVETRKGRFLSAASGLADQLKLDQLTPAAIAAAANLGEHEFAEEFGTVSDYVAELHRRFLDGLLARMIQAAGDLKPGIERILRSSISQLDACLEQRALRAWFSDARRRIPRVAEELHQRNRGTAMMISIELSELGCHEPMIIARFYTTMMLEAAQMEADAGRAVAEVRQALRDFLLTWILARGATTQRSAFAA